MKVKCLLILLLFLSQLKAQKVGVVLSGGGAAGSAHVGVLKALEESEIPIDYIVGTSIGALIGGLYAAGYSPEQIEVMISSPELRNSGNGLIDEKFLFYFTKTDKNSSVFSLNFNVNSVPGSNFPTNLVSSISIDYGLMELFSPANVAADRNFDQLMVPFRATASNVTQKKQTIFKSGDLSKSIRASMTYPFYISPITIDGDLMFDGGLENNFPVDIMCDEFFPDYIIASNVASQNVEPTEDNFIAQLRSILTNQSDFEISCGKGIIINTDVKDISTFDFYGTELALKRGYFTAKKLIDSIQMDVKTKRTKSEATLRRNQFNSKKPALKFDSVKISGGYSNQSRYFKRSLNLDKSNINSTDLRASYYRLTSNPKIRNAYPTAIYNKQTGNFQLDLDIKKEKIFKASFGGVITTKPFSTGFFQLDHNLIKKTELTTSANIYFGSFYNSAQAKVKWNATFGIPFYIESKFSVNSFDYFNGRATFIDDINPPYIINSERYWSTRIAIPFYTNGKIMAGYSYMWQNYEYYQSNSFVRGDTSDRTSFEGNKFFITYDRNSLNRKQYATKGSKLLMRLCSVNGRENTTPGSTAPITSSVNENRSWFEAHALLHKYFLKKRKIHLGVSLEANVSSLPIFQNYTVTSLISPAFAPLPENRTIFQDRYRARSYAGIGLKAIYSFRDLIDFRAEIHLFKPFEKLSINADGSLEYGEEVFSGNFYEDLNSIVSFSGKNSIFEGDYIGTLTSVYHSKVGPIAASLNYYDNEEIKFSFLVHFGYILFNKKGLEE